MKEYCCEFDGRFYTYDRTLKFLLSVFKDIKEKKLKDLTLRTKLDVLTINDLDISIYLDDCRFDSVKITKPLDEICNTLNNGMDANNIVVNNVDIFNDYYLRFINRLAIENNLHSDNLMEDYIKKMIRLK